MADLGYKSWIENEDYVDFDPRSPNASSAEEREAARRFWDSIQLSTLKETAGADVNKRVKHRKKPIEGVEEPEEAKETAEEKERKKREKMCMELLHHKVPDWVLQTMVPQLEKIYEETKSAKRNLKREKREKAKLEPEEGFFPTEQRRPNIGICQVCPVIGPKKSYPTLTFDNLGRPNGKNELQPKSKESRIQSKTSRRKEPTSGNGTELDDDVNAHWWREKRPLPPEKKDYDHEGIGAKRDFTKEGVEIVNLPPSLTRNFDGEFTCDNIKERRKDY